MTLIYGGWKYSYNHSLPVTGRWRAERFGVGMCAGTEEALKRMIDAKNEQTRLERKKRGKI